MVKKERVYIKEKKLTVEMSHRDAKWFRRKREDKEQTALGEKEKVGDEKCGGKR